MPYGIATTNLKGGVGKTTISIQVGTELAKRGKKVLLFDGDPDICATEGLGIDRLAQKTIFDLLTNPANGLAPVIVPYRGTPDHPLTFAGCMDVVPGSKRINEAPKLFDDTRGRQPVQSFDEVVPYLIRTFAQGYDVIIFDPSPSWDRMTDALLFAANGAIAPVSPEPLAIKGVINLLDRLRHNNEQRVINRMSGETRLLGIAVSKIYPDQHAAAKRLIAALDTRHIPRFQATIPYTTATWESPGAGLPVWAYAPQDEATRAFAQLTDEVERLIHG